MKDGSEGSLNLQRHTRFPMIPWLMFSAESDKVVFGAACYQWRNPVSGIINKLFEKYQQEGVGMPYTMEDFQREVKDEVLESLTEEDVNRVLRGLKPEEILKALNPEVVEKIREYLKDKNR